MFTSEALSEIHERSHRNLSNLLGHCRSFSQDELNREIDGFGYPSIRLQFHHEIGAEEYWIGVLLGRMDVDEDEHLYPTIESLEEYRAKVAARTQKYLKDASADELNTPREMTTWGGNLRVLTPALVFLRTATHLYHHQGQIMAMSRLLGKPAEGMDFPIV